MRTQRSSQLRSGLGRSRLIRTNEAALPKPFDASSQLSRRSSALALRLPLSRSITAGAARLANATRSASDRNARAESGANAPRGMVSGRASELIPTSGTSMSSTGTTRRSLPHRPTALRSRRVTAAHVGATGSASSAACAVLCETPLHRLSALLHALPQHTSARLRTRPAAKVHRPMPHRLSV